MANLGEVGPTSFEHVLSVDEEVQWLVLLELDSLPDNEHELESTQLVRNQEPTQSINSCFIGFLVEYEFGRIIKISESAKWRVRIGKQASMY